MAQNKLLSFLALFFFANPVFAGKQLYIFISFSLEKETLNALFVNAKSYNPVFVMRGLKDNSFKSTGEYLQTLDLNSNLSIIIDPDMFIKHDVTSVPTYVLGDNKLSGNVTAKFAYEKLSEYQE